MTTEHTELAPELIRSENTSARLANAGAHDNPNPGPGDAPQIDGPPAAETQALEPTRPETFQDKRAAIAAKAAEKRAENLREMDALTFNEGGEAVPPFIAENPPEPRDYTRDEKGRFASANGEEGGDERTYTLKVRGNDIPVASRAELLKLAEVDEDEAGDFTEAQLIKLAQKQVAASQYIDEAKASVKTARLAARATDDTLSDEAANQDPPQGQQQEPAPHQRRDPFAEAVEAIQYGDADKAAATFRDAVNAGVQQARQEEQFSLKVQNATQLVDAAARAFEASHADVIADQDLQDYAYNRLAVREIKEDLVKAGIPRERVEAAVGNDIASAMEAYVVTVAHGKAKVSTPDQILSRVSESVRKLRPAQQSNTPAPREPAQPSARDSRLQMKRSLGPQPTRATVPVSTEAPQQADRVRTHKNVVASMAARRGPQPLAARR